MVQVYTDWNSPGINTLSHFDNTKSWEPYKINFKILKLLLDFYHDNGILNLKLTKMASPSYRENLLIKNEDFSNI